jgi:hypothetical protein
MNLIEFKNAEIFSLERDLEKIKKDNGWYLMGDGILITQLTETQADDLKEILTNWLKKNKK